MDATIAAISTAMSASGIGIVRISGENAMDVIAKIYRSKNGKKDIRTVVSHTIHYGFIYDGEEVVDEVLVMIMRGPHTYTGEDTVEIDCHGGVYAMKRVLETVLKNGAVIAEPGEFTKRAFLNGRLDLSQAEAVMDVIQAKNSMALKSSVEQLKGSVQRAVKEIRARLLHQIAYIETALDVLVERLPKLNVKSVAIPPLGCGNGGLDWQTVKELIQKKLKPIADAVGKEI